WVEPSPGAVREKAGTPLRLRLISSSADDSALLLDLKNRARAAGIDIVIDVLTSKSSQKNQGLWDLDTSTPNQNDGNPAFLLTLQWWSQSVNPWLSCLAGTTPCGPWQQAGPEFDALVAQALSSPNYADTQKYAAQAMDLLVDEDAKTIPVAGISRVYGLQRNVAGFDPHPARLHVSWAGAYLTNAP
ncbi:MAG TPA: hypothetical protein VFO65_07510, partial [Acidimicrobiales bacterium]|nr:hypothetical protein [Acidimicrobiales bacterium]